MVSQFFGCAPGTCELFLCGAGEGVRLDLHRYRDVTGTENLYRTARAYRALRRQVFGGDLATLGVALGEPTQVHHLVLHPERVLEALELRHPPDQGQLTALEPGRHRATRLGALRTTPGGLALGRLAAALAGLGLVSTRRGPQVVRPQRSLASHDQSTSSTVTRWRTVWIIPSTSGRSSRTTLWPIRRSPRVRRVSRWYCLPPIFDLTRVIFRFVMIRPPAEPHCRPRKPKTKPQKRRPRSAGRAWPRSPRAG